MRYLLLSCFLVFRLSSILSQNYTLKNISDYAGEFEFYYDDEYHWITFKFEEESIKASFRYGSTFLLKQSKNDKLEFEYRTDSKHLVFTIQDTDHCIFSTNGCTHFGERKKVKEKPIKLSREELLKDIDQVYNTLTKNHPVIYDFTPKSNLDSLFGVAKNQVYDGITDLEFYSMLAPIVSSVGCGHTTLLLPVSFFREIEHKLVPIYLHFVDKRAFIKRIISEEDSIGNGLELLAINGKPMAEIINKLLPLCSSDGNRNGYKYSKLNSFFSTYYSAMFGESPEYLLTIKSTDQKVREIKVASIGLRKYNASREIHQSISLNTIDGKSTALLKIRAFHDVDGFKKTIDTAFAQILSKDIKNLIIDVRNNSGGDPYCAAHLLSYILPYPIPYFKETYPNYEDLIKPINLQGKRFTGSIIFLADGGCFSTTGHFLALVKHHKVGKIVGSETTGTYTCNDGHRYADLKNSRLQLQYATRTYTVAVIGWSNRHGIMPEIKVNTTASDYLNNKDKVLEKSIEILIAIER